MLCREHGTYSNVTDRRLIVTIFIRTVEEGKDISQSLLETTLSAAPSSRDPHILHYPSGWTTSKLPADTVGSFTYTLIL